MTLRTKTFTVQGKGTNAQLFAANEAGETIKFNVQRIKGTDNFVPTDTILIGGEVVKEIHFRANVVEIILVDLEDMPIVQTVLSTETEGDTAKFTIDYFVPIDRVAA